MQELRFSTHIKFLFTVNLALHPFNSIQFHMKKTSHYFFHIYNLPIKPNKHVVFWKWKYNDVFVSKNQLVYIPNWFSNKCYNIISPSFNHTSAIVISRISYIPNLMKLVICVGLERFAKPKNRFRANYYLQSQKIQSVLFWSHTTILRIEFIPFTGYCSLPFSYNTIRLSRYQRTFFYVH